jgi:hypothetical protein
MSAPIEPTISLPLPAIPPPLMVLEDLPCRSCSYNLRTQPMKGLCPECGTPVELSLRGELLRGADPDWVSRLRLGCELAMWGAVSLYIIRIFWRGGFNTELIRLAATAVLAIGTWLLTAPDPSGIGEDRYGQIRMWTRALAIVNFAIVLVGSFSIYAYPTAYTVQRGVALAVQSAWGTVLLIYLSRLRKRMQHRPNFGFGKWWSIVFVLASLAMLAVWIAEFVMAVPAPMFGRAGISSLVCVYIPYRILRATSTAIRDEQVASTNPGRSAWRALGSSLYWLPRIFRRSNVDDK